MRYLLTILAAALVRKYQPQIFYVIGDYRSDTAYRAIETVLQNRIRIKHCSKTSNDRFALMYAICNRKYTGTKEHLSVFFSGLRLLVFRDKEYPSALVCNFELSIPGDFDFIVSFGLPKVTVITEIFFESQIVEVQRLLRALTKQHVLVLNQDKPEIRKLQEHTNAYVMTLGYEHQAMIRAGERQLQLDSSEHGHNHVTGMIFKISYAGSTIPVLLNESIGQNHIMAVLSAVCVGLMYKMNLHDIIQTFRGYVPPAGNLHLVQGIKHSLIVDDSEDATEFSCQDALEEFFQMPVESGSEKFVIIGDIRDFGALSEKGHRNIGKRIAAGGIHYIISVGERSRDVVRGAREAGFPEERGYSFATSDEARIFVQNRIEEGDLVLIVGGKEVRLEKIVKEIMANPLHAQSIIVQR